ncbi:rubrerythrin-like domain-containing protein [Halocatena marina]|nr:rubrerythrin-like domain-containing protein [Halocatena marina]
MRDVDYDPTAETPYECFNCGTIVIKESNPGRCPDCSSPMRNRSTPIE